MNKQASKKARSVWELVPVSTENSLRLHKKQVTVTRCIFVNVKITE